MRPLPRFQRCGIARHARAAAVLVAGALACMSCGRRPAQDSIASVREAARSESEIRELDIEYFRARAERDPTGAMDLAHLGALYLARGRETGDPRDAILAEKHARKSLRNRAARNGQAAAVLQSALLTQHRFREALSLAITARETDPESNELRAAVAEIQMELGDYAAARATFDSIRPRSNELAVLPRLARWAEMTGDTVRARRLLRTALAAARAQPSIPAEQLAWYHLRVGDLELRLGHPAAADSAYRAGLAVHAGDYRLLSALAHSALAQRKWDEALVTGQQAIAISLDPTTLGILSEAAAAAGDTAQAAEYARVLDVAVLGQPGAYHRAWSLFLLDHGRHLERVSARIEAELRTRRDIHGLDLHAWALHLRGRDREAMRAAQSALALGTQDASLYYHAGTIAMALGDTTRAREHLARAVAINPYFHPQHAEQARAVLSATAAHASSTADR